MKSMVLKRLRFMVMAASVSLLAACGGGSEEAVTPANAAASLQSLARSDARPVPPMAAITPEAAAAKIFAFAEQYLGHLFNGGTPTIQAGPFAFRYYAPTGLYLGVVTVPGSPFLLNGVYVLGGEFGMDLNNPYYAGQASLFVDTSDPPPTGSGNKNLRVDVSAANISIPSFYLTNVPVPNGQQDFCADVSEDQTFTSIAEMGQGTLTIKSCTFNGTVGTIAANLRMVTQTPIGPFEVNFDYNITYTYY